MVDNDKNQAPLLQVDSLCVEHVDPAGRHGRMVVRDVSLAVPDGGVLAVTGQSGAGKSTLGLAIMGLLGEGLRVVSGRVQFYGESVEMVPAGNEQDVGLVSARNGRAFTVFQEPRASLNPYLDIGAQIDECLRSNGHAPQGPEMVERRSECLRSVGIAPERSGFLPSELSTGQCQRVMIAMALALGSSLLVGDEPLARVDFRVGRQLIALLKQLKLERRMSMLLLTHDLDLIREVADWVAVIYGGEIVEEGPCKTVLDGDKDSVHPYTCALRRAYDCFCMAGATTQTTPASGCCYATQCPARAAGCLDGRPSFVELPEGHRVRCLFAEKK